MIYPQGVTDADPCATNSTTPNPAPLPGQAALAYRAGTQASFKAAMLAALPTHPALQALTTRASDDPSLALIDAWAMTLDVLTFYQERIANEGYLRTASETRSVLELARAIGYELNPGVASESYVTFTLEEGSGAPDKVRIEAGSQVQSVPGPGEQPQIFETVEVIDARPHWNTLRPPLTQPHFPQAGENVVYLQGSTTGLRPGDALLLVGSEREGSAGDEHWDLRYVKSLNVDNDFDHTLVTLDEPLGWRAFGRRLLTAKAAAVYALRQPAALFGHNAPDWKTMPNSIKNTFLGKEATNEPADKGFSEWPNFSIAGVSSANLPTSTQAQGLNSAYFNYTTDATGKALFSEPALATPLNAQIDFDWSTVSPPPTVGSHFVARWTGAICPPVDGTYRFYTVSVGAVRLWIKGESLIDLWDSPTVYTNNRSIALKAGESVTIQLEYAKSSDKGMLRLLWESENLPLQLVPNQVLFPVAPPAMPSVIHLDAHYPQIVPGSWLVLSAPTQVAGKHYQQYSELYQVVEATADARTNFNLSGKTTRLRLRGENLPLFNQHLRETLVLAQSEPLPLAEMPLWEATRLPGQLPQLQPLTGDRLPLTQPVPDLPPNRPLMVSGMALDGTPVSEVAWLKAITDNGYTLLLQTGLKTTYQRASITIAANVARATHGETRHEVLGSGDAAQANQRFVLQQQPLTYMLDATAAGQSTLQVRVNDILWQETPALFTAGANDPLYTVRIGADQRAVIQFGDGIHGARLPTGSENITATYRIGTGKPGMVKPDQLRLLLTRPLGVQAVTNAQATGLAKDPEQLTAARQNAPRTVLTLDRVVTVQDVEDFARSFGGIGKAQAVWLWDGRRKLVHLTVVGAEGRPVDVGTLRKLRQSIDRAGDPALRLHMVSTEPLRFHLKAKVLVDRRLRAVAVLAQVENALCRAFEFDSRAFGQAVLRSEVLAIIQGVNGVEMVDLDYLYLAGAEPTLQQRLAAAPATLDEMRDPPVIHPAQLLLLAENGIELSEATL